MVFVRDDGDGHRLQRNTSLCGSMRAGRDRVGRGLVWFGPPSRLCRSGNILSPTGIGFAGFLLYQFKLLS